MAETLDVSKHELHETLNTMTPAETDDKYWDIIYSEATREAWQHPEVGTNTGPIPTIEKPEALLEAHSEVPELPTFENVLPQQAELSAEEQAVIERNLPEAGTRTVADHADKYHLEEAETDDAPLETGEAMTADQHFDALLQAATDMIERRHRAVKSGDKSASLDDFEAFTRQFEEAKAAGLSESSLKLIEKLVTSAYELADAQPGSDTPIQPEAEPAVRAAETTSQPERHEQETRPITIGDRVRIVIEGEGESGGWTVVADVFKDEKAATAERYIDDPLVGHHEYSVQKDGRRLDGLMIDQMVLEATSEELTQAAAGQPEKDPAPESADPEDEGIDDVQTEFEPVKAAEVVGATAETEEGSGIAFSERLDNYMDFVERNKQFWAENRAAAKKPHGTKFWRDKWEKLGNGAERKRKLYLAATSALLAVGIGVGGVSVANEANHAAEPHVDDKVPVAIDEAPHPLDDEIGRVEAPPAAEALPANTFKVEAGVGPIEIVNRLGYSNDKWFAIADSMYDEFAVDKPHKDPQDALLYRSGNDVRFDHQGTLPAHFRQVLESKLRAVQ